MKDIAITSRLERKPVTTVIDRKKEGKKERKKLGVMSRVRTRFFRIYRWPVTWREIEERAVRYENYMIRVSVGQVPRIRVPVNCNDSK